MLNALMLTLDITKILCSHQITYRIFIRFFVKNKNCFLSSLLKTAFEMIGCKDKKTVITIAFKDLFPIQYACHNSIDFKKKIAIFLKHLEISF